MTADPEPGRETRPDRALRWTVVAAYAVVLLALASRHEIWRDEGQAWLLARDAPSIGSLVAQLGYEGSPGLWHLLLRPFARAELPVQAMQYLNAALAVVAVGLLALRSPLRAHEIALVASGWPVLGLYGVVARSYTLSMLLAWLVASLHASRRERPWRYAVALALLANTNVHSAILAACLGGELLWTLLRDGGEPGDRLRAILPAGAVVVALALVVVQVWPPSDLTPGLLSWRRPAVLHEWRQFLPLLGVVLLLRAPRIALAYAATCIGLELVFLSKYPGMPWHRGLFAVAFVACLWMARSAPERGKTSRRRAAVSAVVVAGVLLFSVPRAVRSGIREWKEPYSSGRAVAGWLMSSAAGGGTLVAYPCYIGASILPWLPGRATAWYCEYGRRGSYTTWNRTLAGSGIGAGGSAGLIDRVREAARAEGRDEALLAFGYPGTLDGAGGPEALEQAGAELLARFDGAEAPNESMAILRVRVPRE